MAKHLAIFTQPYLDLILSGVKTIDGRFSERRNLPFGSVRESDIVLMKESGGLVLGEFTVHEVLLFEQITQSQMQELQRHYGLGLSLSEDFWRAHANAKFVTLIFVDHPKRFDPPFPYLKKDRRSWIVVEPDLVFSSKD